MRRSQQLRIVAGIGIWCIAVFALVGWWNLGSHGLDSQRVRGQLWRYATGERTRRDWQSELPLPVAVGDPVFFIAADHSIRQVGEVTAVPVAAANTTGPPNDASPPAGSAERAPANSARPSNTSTGGVLFYASAPPLTSDARLTFHETPRSMEWVFQTMLPPDKQRRISEELSAAFEQHHEEILKALRPVVEEALRDALPVVEQQLAEAIGRHQADFNRLGDKYQREIVERELVPLVRQHVWPIVYRNAEPTAKEIGREIWERASLWRFGWRYAYDISPLPEQKLLEQEWDRYVREDVTPVIDSHFDDIINVQKRILSDVTRNKEVQKSLRSAIGKMLQDEEVQELVGQIVREVIVDNPQVLAVFRKHWQSERAQNAFRLASSRMEPAVIRIGEMLLGSPEEGISPEFARVLRNRILRKDRRWLVLHVTDTSAEASGSRGRQALPLARGAHDAAYPFVESRGAAADAEASNKRGAADE